ncbi:MAG: hypothetical protein ACREO5_13905, partial [Candidatus Binatia bacterium]
LDPRGRREIHDLLLTLNSENGVTIILSTHIIDDGERLCNRIAILDKGRIRYEGPITFSQAGGVRYRFRIDANCEFPAHWNYPGIVMLERNNDRLTCLIKNQSPAEAIKTLVQNHVAITEAERLSGDLEDLYLNYTNAECYEYPDRSYQERNF